MGHLSRHNPTDRFTGLGSLYARCRPSYPPEAVDRVVRRCGLGPGSVLVDVGAGTGISSRLFGERGVRVIGIEPNADMRARAEAEPTPPGLPAPVYRDGRAEATGLPPAIADAVLAAQAFHWFDAPAALAEFHRVLKPRGWVSLWWNERDESDPFTAAFGAVIRSAPDAAAVEIPRSGAGVPLQSSPLFEKAECVRLPNEQRLDEEGLLGRAFSASYAPRGEQATAFAEALKAVFRRFAQQGEVVLHYQTTIYLGKSVPEPS